MTVSDASPGPYSTTILGRMIAAGLNEDKARGHLAGGAVRVDGEQVTDPDAQVPWPTRWVVTSQ